MTAITPTSAPAPTHGSDPLMALVRLILTSTVARIFTLVVVAVALWAFSILQWGVPGLYVPALAAVPAIMVLLLAVTRG